MEDIGNGNNINISTNKEVFDLISYESYLSMYLDLFLDCNLNNNFSVNCHMEIPLYTYLYLYDKETIVKQSNYEFSNNLSQDCD